jgi:hypothetical protein
VVNEYESINGRHVEYSPQLWALIYNIINKNEEVERGREEYIRFISMTNAGIIEELNLNFSFLLSLRIALYFSAI